MTPSPRVLVAAVVAAIEAVGDDTVPDVAMVEVTPVAVVEKMVRAEGSPFAEKASRVAVVVAVVPVANRRDHEFVA